MPTLTLGPLEPSKLYRPKWPILGPFCGPFWPDRRLGLFLERANMQLIPFAISPLGLFGPTMNTFLYGTDPITHAIEPRLFPHASKMAKRSISNAVPSNILHRANEIWRTKHPNKFFGGSYKSPDPLTYVTQQFGREVCFANGSFGLTAMSYLESGPRSKSCPTHSIDDVLSRTSALVPL